MTPLGRTAPFSLSRTVRFCHSLDMSLPPDTPYGRFEVSLLIASLVVAFVFLGLA